MSGNVTDWPQIISSGISTLTGAFIAAFVALRVSKRNHEYSEAREEKAAAIKLQNEMQASERKRVREHHFIATKLIFMLEQYADGCAGVATDEGKYSDDRQPELEPEAGYPVLDLSEVSGDWRVLDPRHMYRIHELPVLQSEARRIIDYRQEIPAPPYHEAYFRERQYQYARLGIKAVILAVRLRREAGLPATRLIGNEWSAVSRLRSVWRRERKLRAEKFLENRAWHEAVPIKRNDIDEAQP